MLIASIVAPAAGRASVDLQLHAPDGFLSVPVAAGHVGRHDRGRSRSRSGGRTRTLDERAVPLMGVMAAFIFAAQMFNFQVIGGTSGHLLGGVLAAVLLGPWAATLVMACVIAVQALVFQDGGLVVLGANIFNMGVDRDARRLSRSTASLAAAARRRGAGADPGGRDRGVGVGRRRRRGAWRSSSRISGTTPLAIALPAMVGVHVADRRSARR